MDLVPILILFGSLVTLTLGQTLSRETCSASRWQVDVEMNGAQAVIGGLFEIRSPLMGGYVCGQPHKELIQVYEAARWALRTVNSLNIVPGIKIGMKAYDTCFSQSTALRAAEMFYPQFTSSDADCNPDSQLSLGFLGPLSSWTSKPVAKLAANGGVSVLSPRAMSIELSDKMMFPTFMRTSPTSATQARAMVAALKKMGWERVVVVYTSSEFGMDTMHSFLQAAYDEEVCVTASVQVQTDGSGAQFQSALNKVISYDVDTAVFLGGYSNAVRLFQAVDAIHNIGGSARNLQWMLNDLYLGNNYASVTLRGAVVVVPKVNQLTSFRDYFLGLDENNPPSENPWFSDWYMTHFNCRLPGINYQPYASFPNVCAALTLAERQNAFAQVPFVETTVKAVFSYAHALRSAQQARCPPTDNFCTSLKQMSTAEFHNYLKNVNFQFSASDRVDMVGERVDFDGNGDTTDQDFVIYNFKQQGTNPTTYGFTEIGTYINEVLNLDTSMHAVYDRNRQTQLANAVVSMCPAVGCMSCEIPRGMTDFIYTPGDVVIAGLLRAHESGSEPVSCGDMSQWGLGQAVTFNYAIRQAKTMLPGILNGISLGGLAIDDCDHPMLGRQFLNSLLGGRYIIRDQHGQLVDRFSVKAAVSDFSTDDKTSTLADGLKPFKIPMLALGPHDTMRPGMKEKHPSLSWAAPADDKLTMAIAALLAKNSWSYVQTVNSPTSSGRELVRTLRYATSWYKTCLTASYEIGEDGGYADIIAKIESKPSAPVVVFFTTMEESRGLLQAIRDTNVPRKFVIIATDSWGSYAEAVDGLSNIAHGTITFAPESHESQDFKTWLRTLNPRTAYDVPGFKELYQMVKRCYIDAEAKDEYDNECDNSNIVDGTGLHFGPEMFQMINSVFAVSKSLDKTLKYFCGASYSGVCSRFRADPMVMDVLNKYIMNETVSTSFPPVYNFEMEDGVGTGGYDIFSFGSNTYTKIGSYNVKQGRLSALQPMTYPLGITPSTFQAVCPGNCMECTYMATSNAFVHIPGDVMMGGVFAVHDANPMASFFCGAFRQFNGIQLTTAMTYAIEQVNMKKAPVSLKGLTLGGLIMDHCNVYGRSFDLVSSLYSGLTSMHIGNDFDVSAISAWVIDGTDAALNLQGVAKQLNLPLISSIASSESLTKSDDFPTFFRTVVGDTTLSVAVARLVKYLDYKYVNVIYSDNEFGRSGMKTFTEVATQEEICIFKSYKLDGSMTAEAILDGITFSTTQVVVMWTNVEDTKALFTARTNNILGNSVLFVNPMHMNVAGLSGANDHAFFLDIKTAVDPDYINYISMLANDDGFMQNPFLVEAYMALYQCDLPGTTYFGVACPTPLRPFTNLVTQDTYVVPTINAVYSFTAALDAVLREKCGQNYDGMCSDFAALPNPYNAVIDKMESVAFIDPIQHRFQYVNREGNTGLNLVYYKGSASNVVGDFAGASLHISDITLKSKLVNTSSSCTTLCLQCISKKFEFTYKPGDILLGGVFDVHAKSLTPFTCGELVTKNGFQLLEAFNYAIDKVNDKTGIFQDILKDVKLGGYALDSCQSAIRAGYLVSNVHNGIAELTRNDETVDPNDINVYIGPYSSDSSLYLARILKSLKIPQISFGSTSTALLDRIKYPYFLRTVPADDRQALAMVKFLDQNDIRYVQVLHTRSNYGTLGAQAFADIASQYRICLAQKVVFADNSSVTQESGNDAVLDLLNKPNANTVVVFADGDHIAELLRAVRRNPNALNRFIFIGSETWGTSLDVVSGSEDLAVRSVTMTLESTDIPDFDNYLGTKSPGNYPENPWFPEFYEEMVNCYLTVPNGIHNKQCTSISENIVSQSDYIQDDGILHVINAVYAAAVGIDKTLREVCGNGYTTVCEQYRNLPDRDEMLMQKIESARFMDPSGKNFSFTARGDGNKGYQLHSLNSKMLFGEIAYNYEKIGTFSNDGILKITDSTYAPSWDGSCERAGSCTECPKVRNSMQRYMYQPTADNDAATVVMVTGVHNAGSDAYRCGSLSMSTFHLSLAFMFTMEVIVPAKFPQSYNIRGLVLDNCRNNLRSEQDLYSLLSTGELCNAELLADGVITNNTIAGVVTTSSGTSIAVNRVVAPLRIPIVSSGATSTLLSNQKNFPYFARTVPPDNLQMKTIAALLHNNGWEYFSVVYSMEAYGITGREALENEIKGTGLCIGAAVGIPERSTVAEQDAVIQTLMDTEGSKVVVLIVSSSVGPRTILEAARRADAVHKILWIGTDTWGTDPSISAGLEDKLKGSITIDIRSPHVDRFSTYMSELTYTSRKNIPSSWFEEFYQNIHQCQLADAAMRMTQYSNYCTKDEIITSSMIKKYPIILQTIAAAYSIAKGLDTLRNNECSNRASFKDCLTNVNNWDKLFQDILDVEWKLNDEFTFQRIYELRFNDARFWDVGYYYNAIMEGGGVIDYQNVGSMVGDSIIFENYESYRPADFASACPAGIVCDCEVIAVNQPEALTNNNTRVKPAEPRNYFYYNEKLDDFGIMNYEKVYKWPIWAIVIGVLTGLGLFVTIIITIYFLAAYPVRGGTTILGFMLLFGIMAIYTTNFAFFLPASESTCTARRFLMGMVYCIAFAALLIKAIDNWRYSDMEYSIRKYKGLTSVCSLFFAAVFIVMIQVIIPVEWLILVEPTASLHPDSTLIHDWMWCDPMDMYDKALILSMVYVMFLVVVTAIFSAMAWDSDSNYYESRWIFVSSVCTAGCFLVWMIVTTNAGPPYRDPSVALGNFLNATAILICIPLRKLALLYYVQNHEEAEKMQQVVEDRQDVYSTVYSNQGYEGDMFTPGETKPVSETVFINQNL